MRIISGKYRGLKLAEFGADGIRPTADRVKESLFNIIYHKVAGAVVLDLFCGSGSLGIECLSRGAEFVRFNDVSPESVKVLKSNLAKLKGGERYAVTTLDYKACSEGLKGQFDLIFIDPPYASEAGADSLSLIAKRGLLSEDGVAIYERDRAFQSKTEGLELFDERRYGKTYLSFFKKL